MGIGGNSCALKSPKDWREEKNSIDFHYRQNWNDGSKIAFQDAT
jgi:hypothetical protein